MTYPVDYNAASVAVGDFNGDGKLDLAVAANTICILLGNGNGTFQPAVEYAAGNTPHSIAVGDFNADGKLDLAVANDSASGGISILLGNGDGTFQPAVEYASGTQPFSVAIGDFNGDRIPDLAVANYSPSGVCSILLGTGDGTFQAAIDTTVSGYCYGVAVGDFNGDGKLDLALSSPAGVADVVAILLGNGDGTLQPPVWFDAGLTPGATAIGDFNGDGKPDLAIADSINPGTSSGRISILLNSTR